jgi:hypothetical protein
LGLSNISDSLFSGLWIVFIWCSFEKFLYFELQLLSVNSDGTGEQQFSLYVNSNDSLTIEGSHSSNLVNQIWTLSVAENVSFGKLCKFTNVIGLEGGHAQAESHDMVDQSVESI